MYTKIKRGEWLSKKVNEIFQQEEVRVTLGQRAIW